MKPKILKATVFVLICFISFSLFAELNTNDEFKDPILIGEVQIEDIQEYKWYKENFTRYQPDQDILKSITSKISDPNIHIEVYFGTWCPDSQREVPRFIKLLEQVNFNMKNLKLTALDRDKKLPNTTQKDAKKLNIKMIPTFIFYNKNVEINRFVEFARKTLEHDVLAILSNEGYQHSYK